VTSTLTTHQVGSAKVPPVVLLLAAVIFCLGTSEFMIAGILEPMAADLGVGLPEAGLLITAFAIGMVIGAPAMAVLTLGLPLRATLIGTALVFGAVHVVAALTHDYSVLALTRVVAAVACGGFWAVASVYAVRVTPPAATARALATLVGGLTVANLIGVPAGAWLGTRFGWQAPFWAIAVLTVIAGVLLFVTLPSLPRRELGEGGIKTVLVTELRVFATPRIWLALLTTALFQASVFAAFSYFSPLLTQVAGLSPELVPVVLVAFGVGAFIGVTAGGRIADRNLFGNLVGSLAGTAGSFVLLWIAAPVAPLAIIAVVLVGVSGFSIAGALNARVFAIAGGAPTLAAAMNTAAFNVGNAVGPALGGAVIAAGLGFRAPAVVAAVLAAAGLVVVLVVMRVEGVRLRTSKGVAPVAEAKRVSC